MILLVPDPVSGPLKGYDVRQVPPVRYRLLGPSDTHFTYTGTCARPRLLCTCTLDLSYRLRVLLMRISHKYTGCSSTSLDFVRPRSTPRMIAHSFDLARFRSVLLDTKPRCYLTPQWCSLTPQWCFLHHITQPMKKSITAEGPATRTRHGVLSFTANGERVSRAGQRYSRPSPGKSDRAMTRGKPLLTPCVRAQFNVPNWLLKDGPMSLASSKLST